MFGPRYYIKQRQAGIAHPLQCRRCITEQARQFVGKLYRAELIRTTLCKITLQRLEIARDSPFRAASTNTRTSTTTSRNAMLSPLPGDRMQPMGSVTQHDQMGTDLFFGQHQTQRIGITATHAGTAPPDLPTHAVILPETQCRSIASNDGHRRH